MKAQTAINMALIHRMMELDAVKNGYLEEVFDALGWPEVTGRISWGMKDNPQQICIQASGAMQRHGFWDDFVNAVMPWLEELETTTNAN